MTNAMVNIPRQEIVEVLTGISLLQREDSLSLKNRLNAVVAGISGTPPVKSDGVTDGTNAHVYMRGVVEIMADSLILNDRTSPLVSPAAVAKLSLHAVAPLTSDASDEDKRIHQVQLDVTASFMESLATELSKDYEKDYDQTWRQIEAYRQLSDERGYLDVHDQAVRDEFVRLSSTPEEWLERTSKIVGAFTSELPKMIDGLVHALVAMLSASDPEMGELSAQDLDEIDGEVKEELRLALDPIMAQISGAIESYMDERYIQIWVKPTV